MQLSPRAKLRAIRKLQVASLLFGILSWILSVMKRDGKSQRVQLRLTEARVEIAQMELELRQPAATDEQIEQAAMRFKAFSARLKQSK